MYSSAATTRAGQFNVCGRWLKNVKRAAFGLVVCLVPAVHAQTPRQMEQLLIANRGKIVPVVVHDEMPPRAQTSKTANSEPVTMVAVQLPASHQLLHAPVFFPYDQTDNAFKLSADLPADVRRVAVLPLAWVGSQIDLSSGGEALSPILLAELIKTKKFETVAVNSADLQGQTGRPSWTGAEILPADFFDSLQRVYGCDAVLFNQLTVFRAYAPLAVGWRMKLVDVRSGRILWAVDKIFDADQGGVLNQARRHHFSGIWPFHDASNDWQVENSPRQFGQYTVVQVLDTMPNRKEMAKVSLPATDVPSRR